jgi:hypothetical protein
VVDPNAGWRSGSRWSIWLPVVDFACRWSIRLPVVELVETTNADWSRPTDDR